VQIDCKSSNYIKVHPGCNDTEILSLVSQANRGLAIGLVPNLTMGGTAGTYFLRNPNRNIIAVFKPLDEEAFAPNNPRGYTGKLG